MIKLSVDWLGQKKFNSFIKYIQNNLLYGEIQEQIRILGHHTADHMINTIQTSKKRHSFGNNLESNILTETISTTGGVEVGIGRISRLKTNAPYYEVLNDGGYIPYSTVRGAPLGSFEGDVPDSSIVDGNQNWERSGNRGYFMKPKSPIEGIDYIGKAIRNLDKELTETMTKWGEKFLSGMDK